MVNGINSSDGSASAMSRNIAARTYSSIKKYDADSSGGIGRNEFGGDDKAFAMLDANQDGQIDQTDFEGLFKVDASGAKNTLQTMLEDMMNQLVEGRDNDGDGLLSREEFGGDDETFQRVDQDGDGLVSAEELATDLIEQNPELALQSQLMQKIIDNAFAANDDGTEDKSVRNIAKKAFEDFVSSSDSDGDGALSRNELGKDEDLFNRLDIDGNGLVTADELTDSFFSENSFENDALSYDSLTKLMQSLRELTQNLSKPDTAPQKGSSFDASG